MDDGRLPIVSHLPAPALLVLVVVVAGCLAPAPTPTPSEAPGPVDGSPVTPARTSPSPPPSPTDDPAGSATPLPVDPDPIAAPLASFTIVCEEGGGEPPAGEIGCDAAARLALAAIGGERAAAVRRLDVSSGDRCVGGTGCRANDSTVRRVVARSADFESLEVRVARDPDGALRVWPPVEGPRILPPRFDPPPAAAPALDHDPPAELRTRPPLAFCGAEDLIDPDAFDVVARRCFMDGVLGWSPVELILTDRTTDDRVPVTSVLRFTGRGPIERYVLGTEGWTAVDCAISPIATPAAFVIASPCDRHELHP